MLVLGDVCRCDDVRDETVELKLLRALLTVVTSTTFQVHGQGLLLAVRTCYNVYLTSRSHVNQTTAKAVLNQMLNVVFQRMEANSPLAPISPIVVSEALGLPKAATQEIASLTNFVQVGLHSLFWPEISPNSKKVSPILGKCFIQSDVDVMYQLLLIRG